MRRLAFLCCLAANLPAQGTWHPRASAEFPFWTAAVEHHTNALFYAGYGFELGTEREIGRGQAIGAALVAMRGLAANAVACDVMSVPPGEIDWCNPPRGTSTGAFATFRQLLRGSSTDGHVGATVGAGWYSFDGYYLGKHTMAAGPTLLYGAEAETQSVWSLSFAAGIRAQWVIDVDRSPIHVTTATFALRVR